MTRGASPEMAPMTKKSEAGKLGIQGGGDDDGCDCDDSLSLSFVFVTSIICVIIITTKPCLTSCLFGELVE